MLHIPYSILYIVQSIISGKQQLSWMIWRHLKLNVMLSKQTNTFLPLYVQYTNKNLSKNWNHIMYYLFQWILLIGDVWCTHDEIQCSFMVCWCWWESTVSHEQCQIKKQKKHFGQYVKLFNFKPLFHCW